jgi:hypothetical protein
MLGKAKGAINAVLDRVGYRLVRASAPSQQYKTLKAESVDGWFSAGECRRLYGLILTTTGSILEIGHYLGRSTACICEAISDSREDREFRSYDLGCRSAEEFKEFYFKIVRREIDVPPDYAEMVLTSNMTTTEIARNNLRNLDLESHVELISGDFVELDAGRYDVIFCDAMHFPEEIDHNLPHIIDRSNPGCIWAFHDMNPENIRTILSSSTAALADLSESLGVFRYVADSASSLTLGKVDGLGGSGAV